MAHLDRGFLLEINRQLFSKHLVELVGWKTAAWGFQDEVIFGNDGSRLHWFCGIDAFAHLHTRLFFELPDNLCALAEGNRDPLEVPYLLAEPFRLQRELMIRSFPCAVKREVFFKNGGAEQASDDRGKNAVVMS